MFASVHRNSNFLCHNHSKNVCNIYQTLVAKRERKLLQSLIQKFVPVFTTKIALKSVDFQLVSHTEIVILKNCPNNPRTYETRRAFKQFIILMQTEILIAS